MLAALLELDTRTDTRTDTRADARSGRGGEGGLADEAGELAQGARLLLQEAREAAAAGVGRTFVFGGRGGDSWPRRPLVLPGDRCTLAFAPGGIEPPADRAPPPAAAEEPPSSAASPPPSPPPSAPSPPPSPPSPPPVETAAVELEDGQPPPELEYAAYAVEPPLVQGQASGELASLGAVAEAATAPVAVSVAATASVAEAGALPKAGAPRRRVGGLAHTGGGGEGHSPRAVAPSRWEGVRRQVAQLAGMARRKAEREAAPPVWGFRVEVRRWEPAQLRDSPLELLGRCLGRLMARYAAALTAAEPREDKEVGLGRWLHSPLFAGGLPTSPPATELGGAAVPPLQAHAASLLGVASSHPMAELLVSTPASADTWTHTPLSFMPVGIRQAVRTVGAHSVRVLSTTPFHTTYSSPAWTLP